MPPLRPADWAVVAVAAAAVGAFAIIAWTPDAPGTHAEVRGPGGAIRVDLARAQQVTVPGLAGDSVLEVADGRIRFRHSPCRNRVCIAAGWLAAAGEFAACAPNGVSVLVHGGGDAFDAIAH